MLENRNAKWASLLAGVVAMGAAGSANAAIVINEVYAGGGSASATAAYKTDFVELYNNGLTAVDISGYKLNYAPSTRAQDIFDVAIGAVPASTSLAAGQHYLVQTGSSGTGGANDVTPNIDFNSGASLSNTAGSVRLTTAGDATLDTIGWGTLTNNNFETAAESAPASVAVSMQRTVEGVDTDNNQADFSQAAPTPVADNVPEPTALALAGIAGAFALRRRRK